MPKITNKCGVDVDFIRSQDFFQAKMKNLNDLLHLHCLLVLRKFKQCF
jgi:hypothetical protein